MLRSRRPYASSRSPIPRARCCYSCFVPPQRQPAVAVLGCKTLFPHAQTLRTWGATLLPHAAGPLFLRSEQVPERRIVPQRPERWVEVHDPALRIPLGDRKSTRLNSSHGYISYAVFCLKKKKNNSSTL